MNLAAAAVDLLKLIGLLDDTNSSVQWQWFKNPASLVRNIGAAPTSDLDKFYHDLTDHQLGSPWSPTSQLSEVHWVPFGNGVSVGPAWRGGQSTAGLLLGVGGSIGLGDLQLTLVASIVDGDSQGLHFSAGTVGFDGSLPHPGFLASAAISGSVGLSSPTGRLTVVSASANQQPIALTPSSPYFFWDILRMATYILRAWLDSMSPNLPNSSLVSRLDRHVPAMLGAPADNPANPIQPMPLFEGMQVVPDPAFHSWVASLTSTDNNAAGPLAFLWHLRALLTGNESPKFLQGSYHFPFNLQPESGVSGPPTLLDGQEGLALPTTGFWFALNTDQSPATLALVFGGSNGPQYVPLARSAEQGSLRPVSTVEPGLPQGPLPSGLTLSSGALSFDPDLGDGPFKGLKVTLHIPSTQAPQASYTVFTDALGEISLPPSAQLDAAGTAALFRKLVSSVVGQGQSAAPDKAEPFLQALETFLNSDSQSAASVAGLITALLNVDPTIDLSPFSLSVAGTELTLSLTIGPISEGDRSGMSPSVGRLIAKGTIDLNGPTLTGAGLSLADVRLGPSDIEKAGLAASLLPDLSSVPGFQVGADWNPKDNKLDLSGGGQVAIHQTIGPITLSMLSAEVTKDFVHLGVDLSLALGPVEVAAEGLGVRYPFEGSATASLDGLRLSMDTALVRLGGFFGAAGADPVTDYVGGADIGVADLFDLAAIGGYTEIEETGPDGKTADVAALFLFAAVNFPIGGPPWFYLMGLSAGLGFNRGLPKIDLLFNHPFFQVMDGHIPLTGKTSDLQTLSHNFPAQPGEFWVAGGVKFLSFGFIQGKVILAISFGNAFSVDVLGEAAFGIAPIAYFELFVAVSADAERMLVKAGISPNSYLIDPDIFSLSGDFAMGVWFRDGDFLLSIGGYHPNFRKPDHYPELARAGVKASLGIVHLSLECYFACTPQAIMAGASLSLSVEIDGIGAGLDVSVNILVVWNPFQLRGQLTVVVWFDFFGRHEISVDLDIWTPSFGGLASVDLALVSFDVEFGGSPDARDAPTIPQFLAQQLGLKVTGASPPAVLAFDSGHDSGLFRVDLVDGRASKGPSAGSASLALGSTTSVNPVFELAVRTRLPLDLPPPSTSSPDDDRIKLVVKTVKGVITVEPPDGTLLLPLCDAGDHDVGLTVTLAAYTVDKEPFDLTGVSGISTAALADFFPQAAFGERLDTAQAGDQGASQAVANVKSDQPTKALFDTIDVDFDLAAKPEAAKNALFATLETDDSPGPDVYPLPLDQPPNIVAAVRRYTRQLTVAGGLTGVVMPPATPRPARRQQAFAAWRDRKPSPFQVRLDTALFTRPGRPGVSATIGGLVPAGVAATAPPASPARRSELFTVTLRVLPGRGATRPGPRRPDAPRPPAQARSSTLTPDGGTVEPFAATLPVPTNTAARFDIVGPPARTGSIRVGGTSAVRAITLDGAGVALTDTTIPPDQLGSVVSRTRTIVVIPEPVAEAVSSGTAPVALSAIGLEHDTLLLALGRGAFAAHGCVVTMTNRGVDRTYAPLSTLPAAVLTRAARALIVLFPAVPPGWSLVISVTSASLAAGSAAEHIEWRSRGARLTNLATVVAADRTTMIMDVSTPRSWYLDVKVTAPWQLVGITLRAGPARSLAAQLDGGRSWDFIDDRIPPTTPSQPTVTIEVSP
jgi:hypothetical protein